MPDMNVPRQDGKFLLAMQGFATGIAGNPAAYALCQADVELITQAYEQFEQALKIATTPETRTPSTVATKNTKRVLLEQLYRVYARNIRANAGIDDAAKIDIGIHVASNMRSPRWAPQTSPVLKFISGTILQHTLSYCDSFTPTLSRKPFGARALQLFMTIGDAADTNVDHATYDADITRTPFDVEFSSSDAGKVVTYFGRWAGTRKKDFGPWSLPIHTHIMGGGAAEMDDAEQDDGKGELNTAA